MKFKNGQIRDLIIKTMSAAAIADVRNGGSGSITYTSYDIVTICLGTGHIGPPDYPIEARRHQLTRATKAMKSAARKYPMPFRYTPGRSHILSKLTYTLSYDARTSLPERLG